MIDVDRILAEDLPDAAARLAVPDGDLTSVLARTRHRARRRRQVQLTSLTLVVAVIGGATAFQLGGGDDHGVSITSSTTRLRRGSTGVVWRHADTTNALSTVTARTTSGALYALSTAPGQADPNVVTQAPPVLYRSNDGVEWAPVATTGSNLFLSDLSARGDRLYAVGTGTASAVTTTGKPVSPIAVSWSDDAARTWKTAKLPLDVGAIAAKSWAVAVGPLRIAAGPQGVVAITTVHAELDLTKVLPAGVTATNGWALSDTGVDLLGAGPDCPAGLTTEPSVPAGKSVPATVPSPPPAVEREARQDAFCYPPGGGSPVPTPPQQTHGVVRSFTWAELGVGGDLLQAVHTTPLAFWSADGAAFERTSIPLTQLGDAELAAGDDGFMLVATVMNDVRAPRGVVLRSNDGRSWSAESAPAAVPSIRSLGRLNDRVVTIGDGDSGPSLSTLEDGRWVTDRLSDVADRSLTDKRTVSLAGGAVGPLGVVAVVQSYPDQVARAGGVKVSANGFTLEIADQRYAASVTDGAGNVVVRVPSIYTTEDSALKHDSSDGSVVLVDPATGAERARFDGARISKAMEPTRDGGPTTSKYEVLFSRDGITWSAEPLDDLVDGTIGSIGQVVVTADKVIVTVTRLVAGKDTPGPATVLIGTT